MRALVTGATGFLGQRLVRRLLRDGVPVRILARSAARAQPLTAQGAELVTGEITDRAALSAALDGVDVVYHLAGKLLVAGEPAETYRRVHVEGTRTLLALCRGRCRLERIVHCSTTGVLGVTGDAPADEAAPPRPTNVYEATKWEAELLVREAQERATVRAVIVRPGLVYGPGDLHLLGLFRSIERGLFRPIGRAAVRLHPIHVDDMTEAFVRCGSDRRAVGGCFHVAGREPVTIVELARTIAAALDVDPPRGHLPVTIAAPLAAAGDLLPRRLRRLAPLTRGRLAFLTHSRVYSVARIAAALDFVAPTDLASGIAQTVRWYRDHGHLRTVHPERESATR